MITAIESGALDQDALVTLAELINGAAIPVGPRLFKSTGMSWEDAVMAATLTRLRTA